MRGCGDVGMYRFTKYDLGFGSWNLRSTIWGYEDLGMWECGNVKIYEVRFTKYDLGFGSWNLDLGIWNLNLGSFTALNPNP